MSSITLSWRRPTPGSWAIWTWSPSCQTISTFTFPSLYSRSPSPRISLSGLAFSQVSCHFVSSQLPLHTSPPTPSLVFGFQQFLDQDSELTQELVEEGKEHIKRERRRIQRMLESASRRRDFAARCDELTCGIIEKVISLGSVLFQIWERGIHPNRRSRRQCRRPYAYESPLSSTK